MAYDRHLLDQLKHFVQDENTSATFACGGNVPVKIGDAVDGQQQRVSNRPVVLRWDHAPSDPSSQPAQAPKISLGSPENSDEALARLMKDCQVAGFGFKGKDVVDETYRKARKMEAENFSTDFSPYEVGICDVIAQVLMPSVAGAEKARGVRAELYSLNIYSGPSGKFNAHVDTPRSASQFGSLVVCLPYSHEGGQLQVKHAGQTMEFDWSSSANEDQDSVIKWAAFYSDCEHEVKEVTQGHRITLTYNLHFVEDTGVLAERGAVMPSSLPLYGFLDRILRDPRFMEKGGILGIPCSHAYPHIVKQEIHCLPAALKGVDMAVYEAVRALKLKTRLRPILSGDAGQLPKEYYKELWTAEKDEWRARQKEDRAKYSRRTEAMDESEDEEDDEVSDDWLSYQDYHESGDVDDQPNYPTLVGSKMHILKLGDMAGDDRGIYEEIESSWPHNIEEITWIANERKHEDTGYAFIVYGNNAEMDCRYTFAALLVNIPPSKERLEQNSAEDEGSAQQPLQVE